MGRYNGDLERPQRIGGHRGNCNRSYNDEFGGDFDNYGPRHSPTQGGLAQQRQMGRR